MAIGIEQSKRIAEMRALLSSLRDVSTGEFVSAFDAQAERLDSWVARIAAIGQVKAGKSSTLNALIGETDFLPSDVNPWTTVVTNMRINLPGDPKMGARFDFFDEASWDRIINGDRRVRKAAKTYLPGFDPELLREQTEEMRVYAEKRLGPSYVKLLGKHHQYDLLSEGLLESYVCAGPGTDPRLEDSALGRYSSITKAANIYLDIDEFRVPTILTDTPGVNDPFLVRDEFTCQALDRSDIFLVMLSAHQALTEVDVALIRMLGMQGGKDIIIYINRIDELEDRSARLDRIMTDVTKRVNDAVPDGSFTIICGSALWAQAAMDELYTEDEIREIIKEDRVDEFNASHGLEAFESPRSRLYAASGLPAIKRALSDAIEKGSGGSFLDSITVETNVQINAMKALSQSQRNDIQDRIDVYASGRIAECRETIEDEMTMLAATHTSISEIIDATNGNLDKAMNDQWVALQREMDQHIANFIQAQKKTVTHLWDGSASSEDAQIDLLPLRIALESAFHYRYEIARKQLDATLEASLKNATNVANRSTRGVDAQVSMDNLPGNSVAVTFATSNKKLRIDLIAKRSWAFWKQKDVDLEKTMDGLRRVTSAEVFPATSKMVEAFMATMSERVFAGKGRLDTIGQIVEQSLNDRIRRLREDYKLLSPDAPPEAREKVVNRLRNDIEIIDNRLRVIATKESALADPDVKAA